MIFRQARSNETAGLFEEGYKVWSKNRTFEQYCADNSKEDALGTRHVIESGGEIVSSIILLKLKDFRGNKVHGIGSVLTPEKHAGKGYATMLIKHCLNTVSKDALIFLYSDINPQFYARFGFRALPSRFQKKDNSVCMLRCNGDIWKDLLATSVAHIPNYF